MTATQMTTMTEKCRRALGYMQEKGLDALLVSDGSNMRYLSGFSGATGYLFISEGRQVILTDSRYTTQALEESEGFEVRETSLTKPYRLLLTELILSENVKVIGFEDDVMIYSEAVKLQNQLPAGDWVGVGDALNALRQIKSDKELELIAQAEHIGDLAFTHILEVLHPGMTELEVAVELEGAMKRAGAENLSFDTIAASGYHSAMPHATPSSKVLEAGDFLTMDYGCKYRGYCSDMTRTVVIGKASAQQKEIYEIVLAAQHAGLEAVCAGKRGCDVDKISRDLITQAGYGSYFGHGLGHSVGLYIHEEPRLSPSCREILKPNMTMTVEPGIYVPGIGGVRIEDLVVITENGHRNLAASPKQLIEIG